ncbi:hypothetical protein ACNHUS_08290 [Actinomycetes bacterium M1A6_2h]
MILAHGLGGSTDLPIPVTYALIGGAWALAASFVVLLFAWRTARLDPGSFWFRLPGPVSRAADSSITRNVIALVSVLFAGVVAAAAFAGSATASNPTPGVVYVLLWVGLVPLSLIFGPVWRVVSPARALQRWIFAALRRDPADGVLTLPSRVGVFPAAFGLLAFVWLELVSPDPGSIVAVRTWCLVYLVVIFVGSLVFGSDFAARCDPFEVYSDAVSRLSVLAREPGGRGLVLRNPLDGLGSWPSGPGAVAVPAVLLGSTAYDSFSQIPFWRNIVDAASTPTVVRTLGLLAFVAFVAATFWCAARATGGVTAAQRRRLPGALAHSLVPIVVGYIFAHYLTYLVEKGQQTLVLLADPLGRGWNLLGMGNYEVSYVLSQHPSVVATIKVLCVLAGHIVGVTAAHDASLRLLPIKHRASGQLALMVTMVIYTFGGLYLLFGA